LTKTRLAHSFFVQGLGMPWSLYCGSSQAT
jgi:hypothetical protein